MHSMSDIKMCTSTVIHYILEANIVLFTPVSIMNTFTSATLNIFVLLLKTLNARLSLVIEYFYTVVLLLLLNYKIWVPLQIINSIIQKPDRL